MIAFSATMRGVRNVWKWINRRSLVGSDAMILEVLGLHVYESYLFACDPSSFGTIGMAVLYQFFHGSQAWASIALAVSVLTALVGLWAPRLSRYTRLLLLAPQFLLLMITFNGALVAVLHQSYADLVPRSSSFILADQWHRIFAPVVYFLCALARARAK